MIEFLIHFTIFIALWVSSVIFFEDVLGVQRFENIMLAGAVAFVICTLVADVLTMLILYNFS